MKATVDKDGLLAAVQAAASALPGKSMKPVLDCVRLLAGPERPGLLFAAGTDCEAWMEASARGAEIERPGSAFVAGKKLAEVVGAAPRGQLILEAEGGSFSLRSPLSSFAAVMDACDGAGWPAAPAPQGEGRHEICAATLAGLIRRSAYAGAPGGAMSGVELELGASGAIGATGCDGRRVAHAEAVGTDLGQGARKGVLPLKAAKILPRLLRGDGPVSVRLGKSSAAFAGEGWSMATLLVEGRFADWRLVLPKKKPALVAAADPARLAQAIRQVLVMADAEHRAVKLGIGPAEAAVSTMTHLAGRGGQASSSCPLESCEGKPLALLLNGGWLAEALASAEGGRCTISIESPFKPVVIRFGEGGDLGIVMPLDPPKAKAD